MAAVTRKERIGEAISKCNERTNDRCTVLPS